MSAALMSNFVLLISLLKNLSNHFSRPVGNSNESDEFEQSLQAVDHLETMIQKLQSEIELASNTDERGQVLLSTLIRQHRSEVL